MGGIQMKRKTITKTMALLLAGVMAASLAGCGGGDSNSGSSSNDTAASGSSSDGASTDGGAATDNADGGDAAAAEDLFGDEVSINVMVWDRGNAAPGTTTEDNALTKYIQEQMKTNYNINVTYTSVPRSGSDDKLQTMMAGLSAPDIVFTYSQQLYYSYASSGALREITDVYDQYGSDIKEYAGDAQGMGLLGDERYAVMKQRGEEHCRHLAYIRKDWLDQLGMELPTTKDELYECLKAFQEHSDELEVDPDVKGQPVIPWAMSGRSDTEKMYLNFIGSYVNLADEKDAYIYNEQYITAHPDAKEGLKVLNQWYNEGLITQEFPTDGDEANFNSAVATGRAGFLLDDLTHSHASFTQLNMKLGHETYYPLQCFELEDGTYRNPFEQRYAMFVMMPATVDDEKAAACMKYLNWLANSDNAKIVRFTPDYVENEFGVATEPLEEEKNEKGYPGTCDDLCIMNLLFGWEEDIDKLISTSLENDEKAGTPWASREWYQAFYDAQWEGQFRYPVYGYISQAEQDYGADVTTSMETMVHRCITASTADFESTYESAYNELLTTKHLQDILDARAEYYDSLQ